MKIKTFNSSDEYGIDKLVNKWILDNPKAYDLKFLQSAQSKNSHSSGYIIITIVYEERI